MTDKEPLEELCDSLQQAIDVYKKRMQENPNPCGSRALAFAVQSGLPVQMSYSVSQTARYTGIDAQTIRREAKAGRLHLTVPEGNEKGYRIRVEEVDRWMDEM